MIARVIPVIARTTPINASLSGFAIVFPFRDRKSLWRTLEGGMGERCVNYFTLAALSSIVTLRLQGAAKSPSNFPHADGGCSPTNRAPPDFDPAE